MEHPFLMFLDHTQRRSTVGRTPLDEWSARRKDLYLTTHDTHNRQISMPPVGFEPKISAGERPQAAHLLKSWLRILLSLPTNRHTSCAQCARWSIARYQCCDMMVVRLEHYVTISIVKPIRCTTSQIYFILEQHFTCFRRSFRPSSRVVRLYIQHQVYVIQVLWLHASKLPQNLYDIYLMLYVQS